MSKSTDIKDFRQIATPALLLNKDILIANCQVMSQRMPDTVALRPHMKTAKSIEVYYHATESGFKGITVSTLAEARYFSTQGVNDIVYAVGIVPSKLEQVKSIYSLQCDLKLITDNRSIIQQLDDQARELNMQLQLLIEIDCGGERGGVHADSSDLIELARRIKAAKNIDFRGVLTHAGQSYHCQSQSQIVDIAESERLSVLSAAERLRDELDLHCEIISTGSTPTATYAQSFSGITEMRPGVYMFADVDQYFIGSSGLDNIAATVLTSVIGHNQSANRILIDAGGLALSKDSSASEFSSSTGYGWLCDLQGNHLEGLYVDSVHQEHGLIAATENTTLDFNRFPVGSRLRVLPIHACMTVAAYEQYFVHNHQNEILDQWDRVNRWS